MEHSTHDQPRQSAGRRSAILAKAPADIGMADLTLFIDQQEKQPISAGPYGGIEYCHLPVGDYQIKHLDSVAAERKSEADFVGCCGVERDRFQGQIIRLLGLRAKVLVIESTWDRLSAGGWRSKIGPASVTGTVIRLMSLGLPVALVGNHEQAGEFIRRFLFLEARKRYQEMRGLMGDIRQRPKQRLAPNAPAPETIDAFYPAQEAVA